MNKQNKNYNNREKSYYNFSNNNNDFFKEEKVVEETIEEKPIEKQSEPSFSQYDVKVNHPCLRIRAAASTSAAEVGLITDMGVYHILEEQNGFGKIGSKKWIMLSYTIKVQED